VMEQEREYRKRLRNIFSVISRRNRILHLLPLGQV
jgi:hypothetical protein